jgi:hypothetical protein
MRGLPIRLGVAAAVLVVVAVVQQLALPPYLEHRVANRLTAHGGTAHVHLSAVPAARLLFGHGHSLGITARGLSLDLAEEQRDIFKKLDQFDHVDVVITDSRAGPFSVRGFRLERVAAHTYAVGLTASGAAGDVARYAGAQLGGDFGAALAGLATSALGGFDRPVPVDATMLVDTSTKPPHATNVNGDVAGLPAGPLAAIVANTLLGALD